jgi:hypothetical protein
LSHSGIANSAGRSAPHWADDLHDGSHMPVPVSQKKNVGSPQFESSTQPPSTGIGCGPNGPQKQEDNATTTNTNQARLMAPAAEQVMYLVAPTEISQG